MPDVRLESFEIDDSNKFAVALCKALINLEKGYSPLLIHGERGSGKTHLLSAVTSELSSRHPELSLLYISEEVSVEKVFGPSGNGSNGGSDEAITLELGKKDLLIVDDIERFAQDKVICDKFSALFTTFVDSGRQILVASSRPVQELDGFDRRFLSRLSSGVDAPLLPPRPETRLKILKRECARLGLNLDVGIMQLLMQEAGKDALYLKRLPGHLKTFATLSRETLTREKVQEFLAVIREQVGDEIRAASTEEIVASWVRVQTTKREGDLRANLQEYEKQLAEQQERLRQMEHELEAASSREKTTAAENASLAAKLKKSRPEADEKGAPPRSKERPATEILSLTKELQDRTEKAERQKAAYEKVISSKDTRILELEEMLNQHSRGAAETDERQKRAEQTSKQLTSEVERLNKEKEDQLLALKIQLEDKEQKLALLRAEREKRLAEQEEEKLELQERFEEAHGEKLLLKQELDELQARAHQFEKELNQAKAGAAETKQAYQAAERQRESFERQLQGLQSSQKGEKKQQAELLRAAEQRAEKLASENEQTSARLETLIQQSQKEQAELQARLKGIEEKLAKKEKELSETSSRLKAEKEAGDKIKQEATSAAASFEHLQKKLHAERSELEKAVHEKNSKLAEATAALEKLKKEHETLAQNLVAERSKAGSSQEEIERLSKQTADIEAELEEAREKNREISASSQKVLEEIRQLTSERDKLRQSVSELTSALTSARSESEELAKKRAEKEEEFRKLTLVKADLQNRLLEREQALNKKEREEAERVRKFHEESKKHDRELQAAETELRKRENLLKELRDENAGLAGRLNTLHKDLSALHKAKEDEKQKLSLSLKEAQTQLDIREKRLADLHAEVENSKTRADELATRLDEVQKLWQVRLEREESEWAELENSLKDEKATLDRDLQESTAAIKRLKSQVADLEDRVRQRDQLLEAKEKGESEHILKLKDELKRRNEELQQAVEDLGKANETTESLKLNIDELSRKLDEAGQERERAEQASSEALSVAQKQLQAARQESANLESQLQDAISSRSLLEKRLAEKEKGLEAASIESAGLRAKLSDLETEKSSLLSEKEDLEQAQEQLSRESEDALQAADARLQETRTRLSEAQAREEELLARLNSERTVAAERLERQQNETATRENALLNEKSIVEDQVKTLSQKLEEIIVAREEGRRELENIAELKQVAEQTTARLVKELAERDKRILELQETATSLRQEFSQKMVEGSEDKARFVSLEKELTSKERALAAVRRDYSELQSNYDKAKIELSKAEKGTDRLQAERKKTEQELSSRDRDLKRLQEEILKLQEELAHSAGNASRVNELEKSLAAKDELLASTERRHHQILDQLHVKDEEVERMTASHREEVDSLQSRVKETAKQAAKLQKEYEKRFARQQEEVNALSARLSQFEEGRPASIAAKDAVEAPLHVETEPAEEEVVEQPDEILQEDMPATEAAVAGAKIEPVNWQHTFSDFKCSDSNSFTYNIAEKIARNPGKLYNPLCVYGPAYSGKTHLVHAIGNLTTELFPNLNAKVLTLASLKQVIENSREELDQWVTTIRLLVVEDFDIAIMTPERQTELHAFLANMKKAGAQIILASSVPPIKMVSLQECILRFIEAGLLARLEVDPTMQEEIKQAVEAIVSTARAPFAAAEPQKAAEPGQSHAATAEQAAEKKDFYAEFLLPSTALTIATFPEKEIFAEFEDMFKNPNKRWRNKFPLMVVEEDRQRRAHFFNALGNRLQGVFTGPVSLLSIEKLVVVLSRKQPFDWNSLLNNLIKSHVILIDDCDSVSKIPPSTMGYLRAIIEEILGRDILLMIGMSKLYKKEPVFGPVQKKATKRKI